jgi:plasmid stabilization system protein ParE
MYKLNFSKIFHDDVSTAVTYIKNTLQAPLAAEKLKSEVKKAYKSIRESPLIYPLLHDEYLAFLGFRFIMVKNYMLFFIVEPELERIHIVRFLFGRRDWKNILRGTEEEINSKEV